MKKPMNQSFSITYIDPDKENNKEIIPQNIWQSENISGDMSKFNTDFTIDSNLYHIKSMGKK